MPVSHYAHRCFVLIRAGRRPSEAGGSFIPGYAGLQELSAARESVVKAACGGAWRSYWRGGELNVFEIFRRWYL